MSFHFHNFLWIPNIYTYVLHCHKTNPPKLPHYIWFTMYMHIWVFYKNIYMYIYFFNIPTYISSLPPPLEIRSLAPLKEFEVLLIVCAIIFLALMLLGIGCSYYCLKRRNIKVSSIFKFSKDRKLKKFQAKKLIKWNKSISRNFFVYFSFS